MSKQPGSHNTLRAVVEEILRFHIEEGILTANWRRSFTSLSKQSRIWFGI